MIEVSCAPQNGGPVNQAQRMAPTNPWKSGASTPRSGAYRVRASAPEVVVSAKEKRTDSCRLIGATSLRTTTRLRALLGGRYDARPATRSFQTHAGGKSEFFRVPFPRAYAIVRNFRDEHGSTTLGEVPLAGIRPMRPVSRVHSRQRKTSCLPTFGIVRPQITFPCYTS